jgi:CRISPR-associated protein Csx3
MSAYNITAQQVNTATVIQVSFGTTPAQNPEIVRAAQTALESLGELGGKLALINGPASLPAALVIGHALAHRFGAVAVFDPKLGSYVVAISHDPGFPLGGQINRDTGDGSWVTTP